MMNDLAGAMRRWTEKKSLFATFMVANLLKRLCQVEGGLTSNSCGWNLELFEATRCVVDAFLHWNSAAEDGSWVDSKARSESGPP